MSQVRYGAWHGGPDPLEPPYDIRHALDDIGDDVLAGMSPRSALNRLMRLGPGGRNGLDALRQAARNRARELRRNHRLDGTLDQVRELLDAASWPRSGGRSSRIRTTAPAWPKPNSTRCRRTPHGRCGLWPTTNGVRPRLGRSTSRSRTCCASEVLDAQFAGTARRHAIGHSEDLARVREMMHALNEMLDADARGEHTQEQFDEFMREYGEFFPDNPRRISTS